MQTRSLNGGLVDLEGTDWRDGLGTPVHSPVWRSRALQARQQAEGNLRQSHQHASLAQCVLRTHHPVTCLGRVARDDVLRAVKKLKVLGSGYQVVAVGNRQLIQVRPLL